MNKKLLNDTILYGIAQFGSASLTLLMLPIYTHYFSPTAFGTWDITLTTATLLVPFITFELTSATYRWLIDPQNTHDKKTLISTGFFRIFKNTIIFNVFAIIIISLISFPFKWEALIFINVLIFNSFIQQCTRGLGHNKLFAAQGIIQTAIVVCLNIVFIVIFNFGIEAFFYAHIIAGIIVTTIIAIKLNFKQYINLTHNSQRIYQSYLHYAVPIIPATASWWIMTMADRWIIIGFLGLAQNGIYAIAIKIPAIILMVNTVFSLAWKDNVIQSNNEQNKNAHYTRVFKGFFRLLATSVIILILIAKPVIEHSIDSAYHSSWQYTGILLVAMLFHACSLFWSAAFHSAKRTKALLTTTIIGAAVNIALNLILVPFIGLYGIAIATLVAFLITWILRVQFAKGYFQVRFNGKDLIVLTSLMLVAIPLPFYVGDVGLGVSVCVSVMLFVGYNWKLGTSLVKNIIKK